MQVECASAAAAIESSCCLSFYSEPCNARDHINQLFSTWKKQQQQQQQQETTFIAREICCLPFYSEPCNAGDRPLLPLSSPLPTHTFELPSASTDHDFGCHRLFRCQHARPPAQHGFYGSWSGHLSCGQSRVWPIPEPEPWSIWASAAWWRFVCTHCNCCLWGKPWCVSSFWQYCRHKLGRSEFRAEHWCVLLLPDLSGKLCCFWGPKRPQQRPLISTLVTSAAQLRAECAS